MSLRALLARVLDLLRRRQVERELDDEIRAHLEQAELDNRRAGMPPEEARRVARLRLGGADQIKEAHHDVQGFRPLADVARDARFGLRSLMKQPVFTAAAVVTLALGIGANTAIFSIVDGVLLRPTPFDEMDRLVMVWETDRNGDTVREPASVLDYLDFQERSTRFEELAAFAGGEANLVSDAGDPIRLAGLRVSHELLPMVGIRPLVGRTFTEQEDQPGGPRVALIGEALWNQLFSRDPAVVGRRIRLNDDVHTIVGVLPATADFGVLQILGAAAYRRSFADRARGVDVDVWVPLRPDPESSRGHHGSFVMARLSSGVTPITAQDEMSSIAADLERIYPINDGRGVFVESLADVVFGPVRPALLVLLGAVALVLLAACVNVANLLLARGAARVREVAVRGALGAGMGHLTRQCLVESALLTLMSVGVGIVVAYTGVDLLRAMAPANEVRRFSETLVSRVRTIHGVEAVALAAQDPLDVGNTDYLVVVGREAEARRWPEPSTRGVSAQYFRTLGVPLLQGRHFRASDETSEAATVVLINDAARRRYFAHHDPLHQRINIGGYYEGTVVGVVGNERIHGLTEGAPPAVYFPLGKLRSLDQTLLVRFAGDPDGLANTIRDIVRELDPALPVFGVETLQQTLSDSLGQQRFTMLVLGVFAAIALFLAAIGVYGVLSYTVSQRTREIGIRVAVGADRRDVWRLFLSEGLRLTLAGTACGLLAALGLTRLLAGLLYGVSTRDPWIFGAVFLSLGSVALVASYVPSRRAARVDPIVALRTE